MRERLDLSPAKWIWVPSGRTLPNTFACFRRDFSVGDGLVSAKGYVLADSRYVCSVNGQRVQFGPAPCDPRFEEADPVDLGAFLHEGENTLSFRVVYFGHGEGTWVTGRAGLLYHISLRYRDGSETHLVSDGETQAKFDESHPAGIYKRWYLRALQEIYDARRDTVGFDTPEYAEKSRFEPAMVLPGPADKPSIMNGNSDYLYDSFPENPEKAGIFRREIPMPKETFVPARELYHSGVVTWKRDPEDWFRFRHPDSFAIREGLQVSREGDAYRFTMPEEGAAYLTLILPEECCGFIDLTVEAPEGTVIEAMVQEGHDKEKTLWLDTQFYSWTRFICREGVNRFLSFDYECFSYLQLHVRNARGEIVIRRAGVLRRLYPTRLAPEIHTDDPKIQKVLEASLNTLRNSAVETFVDGMARERQQYSGDCNHQVDAFSYLYGADEPIVPRYYRTWGDGLTNGGFYLDSWPAYDRMNRLAQRELGLSLWGSILDHGVQFALSMWEYARQSGDWDVLDKSYADLLRQAESLLGRRDETGMIPTVDLGPVYVWLDHFAFSLEKDGKTTVMHRDKRCPFNLYVAAMLRDAMAPICRHFGDEARAAQFEAEAAGLVERVQKTYYDPECGLYFDNLPFAAEDGGRFVSDRTLAIALLYDMIPGDLNPALHALAERPPFVRRSYPANEVWRYKALAKYGMTAVITEDLRNRWFRMLSVQKNNALQEMYDAVTDSSMELSHCPLSPILAVYEYWAGLRCEAEEFRSFSLSPHFGGLPSLSFKLRTVSGEVSFTYRDGALTVRFPETMRGRIDLGAGFQPLESGKPYPVPENRR